MFMQQAVEKFRTIVKSDCFGGGSFLNPDY